MCRWFAYISSTEPCLLEDVLVTPAHALTKQVHEHYLPKLIPNDPSVYAEPTTEAEITTRNRLFNVDGFGMAWYTATLSTFSLPSSSGATGPTLYPTLYKTTQPPLHDANFRSICANTATKVLFAHIRAATATAITATNNHPFTFGIHTIMHNGYISSFPKVKLKVCEAINEDAYNHIQGGTDTEHFAALFMSFLCTNTISKITPNPYNSEETGDSSPAEWEENHSTDQIISALKKTIAKVIAVQTSVLGSSAQPNDLNIAITDGRSLVACRFRNHATEQPPSLYYSSCAGVTLNRQFPDGPNGPDDIGAGKNAEGHDLRPCRDAEKHGRHVIVASEPTTYKDDEWELIEKNRVLHVGPDGVVKVEELKW